MLKFNFIDIDEKTTFTQFNTWIKVIAYLYKEFSLVLKDLSEALIMANYQTLIFDMAQLIKDFACNMVVMNSQNAKDTQALMRNIKLDYEKQRHKLLEYEANEKKLSKW